ncbi:dihydroorotase [Lacticaseibacillus porcinae]|uniref:dihydroorotase n=1 Tax=Lacticaseibacillus porcinae TaxID=1123687 RepID=UPI000F7859E2|nr:dihydroorotase [Lacticaseibacillus porcinae]
MHLLIKNAHVVGPEPFDGDLLTTDGVISALGHDLQAPAKTTVIDLKGATLMPGLVDVHVHFREPGYEAKETIKTGAQAAAHGGYTTVVAMPNLNPVPDNVTDLENLIAKNHTDAKIHVYQFAAITAGLHSQKHTDYAGLRAAGALGFSNDGVGVQDAATMYQAMQGAAKVNAPIVAHIEDEGFKGDGVMNAGPKADELGLPGMSNLTETAQLARDLVLAEASGVHYHACHVSTATSVDLIRFAKARGVNVTAEVSPHHLLLADQDIPADDAMYKMNPPLRSEKDRQALIAGLLDGTLDMIATDHAPHTAAEKTGSMLKASFGIVGSETAFALLYTHFVMTNIFTLEQLVNWMSTNPAEKFGLNAGHVLVGEPADLTVMDLCDPYTIDPKDWFSKGHNSPFIGEQVYGRTLYTIAGGRIAYKA